MIQEGAGDLRAPDGARPSALAMVGQPRPPAYVPQHQTLTEMFGAPEAAPLGTACVFPEWQDEHHPRQIALRLQSPHVLDEKYPWVLLDSDGPQVLSNESVVNCEWLPLEDLARELGHRQDSVKPKVTQDQVWQVTRSFHDATRATPFVSREQAWQSGDFESMKDAMEEAGIEVLPDGASFGRGGEA